MDELVLADYFAIVRRWKKVFLIAFFVLLTLSFIYAVRWSNYRSTAVVQIEQSEISSNATLPMGTNANDAMEALADQRISQIQQKVEATASLIEIITKFDLYAGARQNKPIALVADDMRKKIKIDLVSGSLANPAAAGKVSPEDLSAIAFNISFDYKDPLITQQVTDELVTRFLDEDLKQKRTETQETADFLSAQITAMDASMSEQEAKIADYQKTHGDSRPESLAFNQQAAASLTLNLQNLDGQISTNEGSIGSLRGQLAGVDPYSRVVADGQVLTTPTVQLKALQAQYASLTAQYGPEHPDVVKVRHQIEALQGQVGHKSDGGAALQAQITDVRTNLAAAQKTYGPDHPDVIALKNQLQRLEDQLAKHRPGSSASSDGNIADADNPAYLQLVAELRSAQEQSKSLAEQRKELQAQLSDYQKAIIENPEAAQEMAALSRDYDNAQMRYRELKEKKMAADMDLQMQQDRKGARLTLIDPPELPLKTQPARILLLIGGFIFSLLGGFAAVVTAQILGQKVVGVHHLESIVGVAPLVAVPHIYTRAELENSARQIAQRKICEAWDVIVHRFNQSKGNING